MVMASSFDSGFKDVNNFIDYQETHNPELFEADIFDFQEEHELNEFCKLSPKKEVQQKTFDGIISTKSDIYCIPTRNKFFDQIITKFKRHPLDQMIIIKQCATLKEKSMIGISFETAVMVLHFDHPLIQEIAQLATPKVEIEFRGFSFEDIQKFYNFL
uniref:Uncharacterized protein n=1 Tax=Panagrolaimus sp. ES5 TaxID=591445 RepID=A0AC34FJV5_9BILA